MSFILDAIKKSESERQKGKQPDVYSLQNSMSGSDGQGHRSSRMLLLLIATVLLIVLAWWLWPQLKQQFLLQTTVDQLAAVDVKSPVNSVESSLVSEQQDTEVVHQAPVAQPSNDALPPRHLIKELWELPADYQSTVPELSYSFHVFSSDPAKRMIIINDRRMREGQRIASHTRLRVITETGVILEHGDKFFHVDVVEKW